MKLLTNLKSGFLKIVAAVAMVSAAASCYDDTSLQEQINMIVDQLFELDQKVDSELKALKSMLNGKILITNVSTDASTGITTVTLSDGNSFQLLPEKDMKSFVTYITLGDGNDYWAYIDKDGKTQLFLDEEGKPVSVISDVPEVVEVDGEPYILIGGVMYPFSGNSVFSDYELIKDELTGEVYAVTFTFGEDMTFTVTVDGACGFYFVKAAGGFGQVEIINDYYVSLGKTERVQISARGVVDYVLQIPDGWRVKEYEDIYMGEKYFDITAPTAALVESGVAVDGGELKVVAVLEGGKATVAKLNLSSDPFKVLDASFGKLYVEMSNGLQKYVCGVCSPADYDEAVIFSVAEGLLEAYDYPDGYSVCDYDLLAADPAELAAGNLVLGEKYMFWAIPAIYFANDEEAGYYLEEGTFVNFGFTYSNAEFEVVSESYSDAEVVLDLDGVDNYYFGLVPAVDYMLEDVVYCLNIPGYFTGSEWTYGEAGYAGSVFALAGIEPEPQTEYVAWVAVAEDGKTYTERDLLVCEFSTLSLEEGGSVNVVSSEVKSAPMDITVSLAAEGAESIFYAFLTSSEAGGYADDAAKAKYLFEKGLSVNAESAVAVLSDFDLKRKPETEYVLFAVASDKTGKYGKVLNLPCETSEIVYNDIEVTLAVVTNEPNNVVVSVSAENAVDYLYWIGKTSDNTWRSSNYLGGSAETAQAFMYVNPDHSRLQTVMSSYPVVDGKITMTDLAMDVDYVMVVMAKDAEGGYSEAEELRFKPRAVSIGKVVLSTDTKWEAARPSIEWRPDRSYPASGQMPGQYGYYVTIPSGFTGYVLSGTDSYLNDGNAELVMSAEEKIIKILQMVDKSRDSQVTVDYDLWGEKGYPYGYEFYHHEHGNPLFGNVVIWANQEFHDSRCDCGGNHDVDKVVQGVPIVEHHVIHLNDGSKVDVRQPYAVGSTMEVIDKVFVVCQDLEGNCYEPFAFDVPVELFANGGSREDM